MQHQRLSVHLAMAATVGLGGLLSLPAQAGDTLDAVKNRGAIKCGVNVGLPGFASPDSKGVWQGLDVDFCKTVAVAVFGDADKVEYVPLSAQQRFTALQSGEIDVMARNTTWTLNRDTALGLDFTGVSFYDGQGFMVRKDLGVTSAKELDGATVCTQPGTTTELNLADWFRANQLEFQPVVIESFDELNNAFFAGRCDVYTTDRSGLASIRTQLASNPDDYLILPESVSKEPLGPAVRQGDTEWFDIVKWSLYALIEAEELGINSQNVDEMAKSDKPGIQRFLGVTPGLGENLKVDEKWAYNIVKQVGNYGEIYQRNVGEPLGLERGLNELWTRGGLMYSPPFR